MSETKPSGVGPEEKEFEPTKTPVWIVDDNREHINSLLRAVKSQTGEGFEYTHYQEGEQAIANFSQIAEEKGLMPALILMDYKLDDRVKNPKYRTGVEVIEELKRIAEEHEIPLPEIAAFSTEKSYAEQLIQAGASMILNKMNYMALVEHLREIAEGADQE